MFAAYSSRHAPREPPCSVLVSSESTRSLEELGWISLPQPLAGRTAALSLPPGPTNAGSVRCVRALRSGCGVNPRDVVQHTRTGNPLVDSVAEHQPASAQAWHAPRLTACRATAATGVFRTARSSRVAWHGRASTPWHDVMLHMSISLGTLALAVKCGVQHPMRLRHGLFGACRLGYHANANANANGMHAKCQCQCHAVPCGAHARPVGMMSSACGASASMQYRHHAAGVLPVSAQHVLPRANRLGALHDSPRRQRYIEQRN